MSSFLDGWVETTLGEVATFQRGFDLPAKDRTKGKFPLMVSNGQSGNHNEYKVIAPGIITGRSGTLGQVFYVKENFWALNTTLWVKDFHGNDVEFIYYFLKTFPFEKYNSGSGVPTLNRNHIHPIQITFPKSLSEQESIANILSSFDEKIELLREQNETLETLAQTIFKEWFVDFNYPDATGEMVDSEFGEIPKGWRVGMLGELVDLVIDNRGKTPPTAEKNDNAMLLVEVNSIIGNSRAVNIDTVRKFVSIDTYKAWFRKGHPIKNDILISTVGSIGELCLLGEENISIAQNIVGLRNKKYGLFLYQLILTNIKRIKALDISSVQPSIKVPHMLNIEVIIPVEQLLNDFTLRVKPISEKILQNNSQIRTLTKTRDTLLPKLMSGEIRVSI